MPIAFASVTRRPFFLEFAFHLFPILLTFPDPEAKAISCLFDQLRELENKYNTLAAEHNELKQRVMGGN